MIVVVGNPAWSLGPPPVPAGRAARIALVAAGSGAAVELVGRAGDDAPGDELVLALARGGVGHVALLRDPARATRIVAGEADREADAAAVAGDPVAAEPDAGRSGASPGGVAPPSLEPADVSLGLRYLASFEVLVVSDDAPAAVVPACVAAADYVGARLVVLVRADTVPDGIPAEATVLQAPPGEGEAFAAMVGAYAAALDHGASTEAAFATAVSGGWEPPAG